MFPTLKHTAGPTLSDTNLTQTLMNYDINERETSVDNMADSLFSAMQERITAGNNADAIAITEEWLVGGIDPQDGGYEFLFVPNFTLQQ